MAIESRLLSESTSFAATAQAWGIGKGLLDSSGNPVSAFPSIIGMPAGSTDLGAFNFGIIGANQTIKGALQDLETGINNRLVKTNNLSDLSNVTTARTNLGLGSAATWNTGTSGAAIPLLNAANTWSAKQTFGGTLVATSEADIVGTTSTAGKLVYFSGSVTRWQVSKDATNEAGNNSGSDFVISRYNDAGTLVDNPLKITRSTGVVTLSQPLPVGSGGTGVTSLLALKTAMGLDQVDNSTDLSKPISTAVQSALDTKMDKTAGTFSSSLVVGGSVSSGSFVRAVGFLTVDGLSTEGGQLVLGYKNVTNLSGQTSGTWNVDVATDNSFRVFGIMTTGAEAPASLSMAEYGALVVKGAGAGMGGSVGPGILVSKFTTSLANIQVTRVEINNPGNGTINSTAANMSSALDFSVGVSGMIVGSVMATTTPGGVGSMALLVSQNGSYTNSLILTPSTATFGTELTSNYPATFDSIVTTGSSFPAQQLKVTGAVFLGSGGANTLSITGLSSSSAGYIKFGSSPYPLGASAANSSNLTYGGFVVWHSGNTGPGSGMNADMVDGNHASDFVKTADAVGLTRAWGKISGTGAIQGAGNIASVTVLSTGLYRVNFTTAMPADSYAVSITYSHGGYPNQTQDDTHYSVLTWAKGYVDLYFYYVANSVGGYTPSMFSVVITY